MLLKLLENTWSQKGRQMKRLIGLFVLIVICLAFTGCPDDSESDYVFDVEGANQFIDPNGRYSVIYPSDWYYFETTTDEEKITTGIHLGLVV